MADIEALYAKLDPKTRNRLMKAVDIPNNKIETQSLGLNMALNGGLPAGRMVTIWGNKSSGKTALAMQTLGIAQKAGLTCALIDAEGSYDKDWATRLGINNDQLLISPSKSVNDMTADGVAFLEAGVDILLVDSISTLVPGTYFEKDSQDLKELDGTKGIGGLARDLSNSVNMLNFANKKTLIIFISQTRNKIGSYGSVLKPQGGEALMFYSSTVIKVWSTARPDDQIQGTRTVGDRAIATPIGREVTWTVEYSKTSAPSATGKYNFYYAGDNIGVDQVGEIFDYGVQMGVIEKGGAWFTIGGNKVQGKPKGIELLRSDEKLQKEIMVALNG